MTKQTFDPKSPGFIYSVAAFLLTAFSLAGVAFAEPIGQISGQLETSIQGGSYIALVTVFISSVLFPFWNVIQKKQKLNFKNLFASTANILALVVALLGVVALTGFVLPQGTVEQVAKAVEMKDWASLISIIFTVVVPTIVRFIKDQRAKTTTAAL